MGVRPDFPVCLMASALEILKHSAMAALQPGALTRSFLECRFTLAHLFFRLKQLAHTTGRASVDTTAETERGEDPIGSARLLIG